MSDAVVAMVEKGVVLPQRLTVRYTEKEWEAVERFHRMYFVNGEAALKPDRYPFVDLLVLGIEIRLMPWNPVTEELSIQETRH